MSLIFIGRQRVFSGVIAALCMMPPAIAQLPVATPQMSANDYYERGLSSYAQRDWEGAIAAFTHAIQLKPGYSDAYFERGFAYGKLGKTAQAIDDYAEVILANFLEYHPECANDADKGYCAELVQRILENRTQLLQTRPRLALVYYQSLAQFYRGQAETALDNLNWTIWLYPKFADAYYFRGRLQSSTAVAIQDFSQAIQLDSAFTDAYYYRALAYYDAGDRAKAIADVTQVIQSHESIAAYLLRGRLRSESGDPKAAQSDYLGAYLLRLFATSCRGGGITCTTGASLSQRATYYYDRAQTFARRGDRRGAIANFQQAASAFLAQGNRTRYQEALNQINRLKPKRQ